MPATASLPVPTTVSIFCSATAGASATADADAAAGAGARSQPDTAKVRVRPITQEESSCFVAHAKRAAIRLPFFNFGAGEESRTLDLNLGKVALYQLSYSRVELFLEARIGVEPT